MAVLFGILLAAVVIFGAFAVAFGHGGSMTHFQPDWPGRPLPQDRPVRASDLSAARFSVALRGYRMAEVDDALDRLAAEIAQRDAKLEALTGRPFEFEPSLLFDPSGFDPSAHEEGRNLSETGSFAYGSGSNPYQTVVPAPDFGPPPHGPGPNQEPGPPPSLAAPEVAPSEAAPPEAAPSEPAPPEPAPPEHG